MSQLIAPTHTLADNIPLGRRITEIMTEKGPAYTIAAMAKRLEINRETLRLMLKGEREIYTFELEKIAQDLKVPVERILQSDIAEIREQVKAMIIRNDRAEQFLTLELAKKAASVSIGLTERCIGENELSCVYSNLNQFEIAFTTLMKIQPDAELILEKYGDPEVYLWVTGSLLQIMTMRKEYTNLPSMVAKAEPHFSTNPRIGGINCYAVAKYKEEAEGDYHGAREKYYQMLDYYKRVEPVTFARAQVTVGLFEYRQGNYQVAEELFQQAMQTFDKQNDMRSRIMLTQYYGKLLIRLHKFSQASEFLMESLEMIRMLPDMNLVVDYQVQVLLLLAIATNDPQYAEKILYDKMGTISIQKIALKFLMEQDEGIGERSAKKQQYESIAKQLRGSPIDIMLPLVGRGPDVLLSLFDLCHLHGWHQTKV